MAYKLLSSLLPIEIVGKVLDYSIQHDIYKQHLYKINNIEDLKSGSFYTKLNYNCAKTFMIRNNYYDLRTLCKIVKIVPDDISKISYIILDRIYKKVVRCYKCKHLYSVCRNCDYSVCNDDEMFKTIKY